MDFQLNLQNETITQADAAAKSINLEPTSTVREAFHRMKEGKTGAVLVWQDEKLVGIFTERDALKLMANKADLDAPLQDHMATEPVTIAESDTVGTAISKMSRGGYRRLPVVDEDGNLKGIVKTSGILHYLVSHFSTVIYNLPPTPHPSTQQREGA